MSDEERKASEVAFFRKYFCGGDNSVPAEECLQTIAQSKLAAQAAMNLLQVQTNGEIRVSHIMLASALLAVECLEQRNIVGIEAMHHNIHFMQDFGAILGELLRVAEQQGHVTGSIPVNPEDTEKGTVH